MMASFWSKILLLQLLSTVVLALPFADGRSGYNGVNEVLDAESGRSGYNGVNEAEAVTAAQVDRRVSVVSIYFPLDSPASSWPLSPTNLAIQMMKQLC
jgi:hypothetical protein